MIQACYHDSVLTNLQSHWAVGAEVAACTQLLYVQEM